MKIDHFINKIIQGENTYVLKKIPNQSIDFIFADPPYFMQTEKELLRTNGEKFNGVDDDWDKFKDFNEYDEYSLKWLTECQRLLKPNGTICVIGSFQNIFRIGYLLQNLGFWIINDIVWSKTNPVPNFAGTRFVNSHETMIWAAKSKKSKFTFNYKTMKFLNNQKQEKSVWNISLSTGKERLKDSNGKKIHNTQKPEALLYKIILAATKPNDLILDPFFGTGTTGVIAKKIKRNWIGIEREFKYIEPAQKRIENTQIESNNITNLDLEVKPPKVSVQKLLEFHYLKPGDSLYDKNNKKICTLLETGKVWDGEEELSIHKMSAKKLNKINNNGWDYFYVEYKNKIISINDLRYLFTEKNND
ncbi:site-specific DNA-methyltransferase [Mycoplasmopsis felis]|uniref:DNA-methyltransferase n=1 Tax=Mycoplasmopsis felis TaxID=33923 RepID=UPI003A4E2699